MTIEQLTELCWEFNRLYCRHLSDDPLVVIPWLKLEPGDNGLFSTEKRLAIEEVKKLLAIKNFATALGMTEGEYAGKLVRGTWLVKEGDEGRLFYRYVDREGLSLGMRNRHYNFRVIIDAYRHMVDMES